MCEPVEFQPKKLESQYSLKILSLGEHHYSVRVSCKKYRVPFHILLSLICDFNYCHTIDEDFLKEQYLSYESK